ncbi:NADPH-dependent FMN reductase [Nocardia camponoti]|uniref:NADPH-dependent FMN reductase-like domain-containing protein n=1 Tax=Nocardia camponoti TaxID=1616106 RepID=A0A917QCL9_9NOCA|nr:NAD(P)H-dependent oxidoreductase [Nocardia camponoti]GGK43787.1 hypothetical protein GCM10011591_14240 [Nocardia camponoti]
MGYLLALVADPTADSKTAKLATEAQKVAVRNNIDVVILEGLDKLPAYSAEVDTTDGRPLIANELRRSVLEADGVLLFTTEGSDIPELAESVVKWVAGPASGPTIVNKPTGVITVGPGEVVNQHLADQLRKDGANVVVDGVSIATEWFEPNTINRLGDAVVMVESAAQ